MPPRPDSEEKLSPRFCRSLLVNLSAAIAVTVLSLLLALQGLLLIKGSLQIPEICLTQLHAKLEQDGLQANYRELSYRFPGSLIVKNLQLVRNGDEDSVASAEAAQVDLSLLKLLQGQLKIRKVTLYGGRLFCPGLLSPTGMSEKVLDQAHLVASQSDRGWMIHNVNGKLENLSFTASGAIHHLPKSPKDPTQPVEWASAFMKVLPEIVREREVFQLVQNPRLHLQFSSPPGGALTVHAKGWAEAVQAPHHFQLLEPRLATQWTYDGSQWQGQTASFEFSSVDWDSMVTAQGVTGTLHWAPAEGRTNLYPVSGNIALAQVETPAGVLTDLQATLTADDMPADLTVNFYTLFQGDPLEGKANFDWQKGSGDLQIKSRINPTPILQHDIARQFGLRRDIFFQEPLFARAAARFDNWEFMQASAHAVARQADIDGVFMNQASARVELFPERFVVSELFLAYEDFEAHGSYEIDFATRAYRFLFEGTLRPLHISAWFQDWWVRLWEDFSFDNAPLWGDVDIRSVLQHSKEVRLVGSIGAANFHLRSVPFETMHTHIFVLNDYADLFNIQLTRTEGTAHGSFQYWADRATGSFAKLVFEVDSTVNPTDLAQIFREAGSKLLSPFQFTDPPTLNLGGTIHASPRENETLVKLHGKATAPLEYQNLPLEHLTVEGLISGNSWTLPRLEAGFAGGHVAGHAKKWMEEDEDRLKFGLLMRDLDLAETLTSISSWQTKTGAQNDSGDRSQNLTGIFDMNLKADGLFGDFQSFSGDGSIKIQEANLAEIHLLGLLSRILSITPLGFTSLQFKEAEARFEIDLDKIHIPELRLTGPTSAISGSGNYLMDQDKLDFLIKLHFLKESKIPFLALLLSPVLEPLAQVMEIRLTGTSADPQWRFLLGPRNILSGISGAEKEESSPEEPEN